MARGFGGVAQEISVLSVAPMDIFRVVISNRAVQALESVTGVSKNENNRKSVKSSSLNFQVQIWRYIIHIF